MQGQLLLSLIVAVLVYLGLTILGVPYAFLLAIGAGVLELIPVFGSILAAIPAIAIAFVNGGTTLLLLVAGLYLIVNQFQSNLIYPLVVKKVVGVPPLLVILSLIIGMQLAGFLGIILSVPVAAALQEFVTDVQKEKRALLEKEVKQKG
jgi:predicted PurR-regulated permease PerM